LPRLFGAICHEPEVRHAFPNGIIWATLGESLQVLKALINLYSALRGARQSFGNE
jgi:hypothetical protein